MFCPAPARGLDPGGAEVGAAEGTDMGEGEVEHWLNFKPSQYTQEGSTKMQTHPLTMNET